MNKAVLVLAVGGKDRRAVPVKEAGIGGRLDTVWKRAGLCIRLELCYLLPASANGRLWQTDVRMASYSTPANRMYTDSQERLS